MSTFTIFLILIIAVCFLLVLVVMVQNPKGGGLSSSFGGGGNQIVGGVKKTGDFLDKSTWTLATLLVVLILLSNVAIKGNFAEAESKLLQGDDIENTVPETVPEEVPEEVPAQNGVNPIDTIQ
jgi:preprotein translocase subunit SecG